METLETQTASITTNCLCQRENEETGESEASESCFGDCHEWQQDDVGFLVTEWQKLNNIEDNDPIFIECGSMGWRNASAYKWDIAKNIDKALYIDGGFTIEYTLTNNELTARRFSHDEPMGTGIFTFTHFKPCVKCGEPVKEDIAKEELEMCVDCSNDYFGEKDE